MGGATGRSVLKHPNKEEIDERLLAGESVEKVANWLKQRFSRNKKLQVSKMTLQAYRKQYLNLDGDVLADLKKERGAKLQEERKRRALEVAHSGEAYQVAKAQYAEDYALQIQNTNQRLEECYLKIQEQISVMEGEKVSHLNAKVIVEQVRLLKDILKDAFEMEQQLKEDQQTTINIDVHKIVQEMKVMKAAVREAITELCPEVWPVFFDKLNEKMKDARLLAESDEISADGPVNINING